MKWSAWAALGACIAALSSFDVRAADAVPAPARPSASAPSSTAVAEEREASRPTGGEPVVRRTVIEDGQTRIEELRVRGNLQKVTVAPKGRAPGYEVLTGDGFHATADDPGTSRGSAGKRVWNVLRF
jgi:hypothetical protein